jgi:RecB family exonuclease
MRAVRKTFQHERKQRKPVLSPTRIAIYLDCVVKYRYTYIDKIARYYSRARSYYSFGSTLHHVLQEFHSEGASSSSEALTAAVDQNWIAAGYETPAQESEHREAGHRIVEAYHAAHQERVEQAISTLAVEKMLNWDMGEFRLSGRVDRLDQHADGSLDIIDYKSGRMSVDPSDIEHDLAMACYNLLVRKNYPGQSVVASIYCLRSGEHASFAWTDEQTAVFEEELTLLGQEIVSRDLTDVPPVPLDICPECDFLPKCRQYWRLQDRDEIADPDFPED